MRKKHRNAHISHVAAKTRGDIHCREDCATEGCLHYAERGPQWEYFACRAKCDGFPITEDEPQCYKAHNDGRRNDV